MAQALDPGGGAAGANVALRVLDAVDPLVEVSAVTSVDTVLSKIARGEDPTWAELNAVFGPGGPHETKAVEAPAGPDASAGRPPCPMRDARCKRKPDQA